MIRFLFLTIIWIMIPATYGVCQEKGVIEIHEENIVTQIVNDFSDYAMQNPKLSGFRIQIFFSSGNHSKQSAINAQSSFQAQFPEIETYLSFEEPNYKVRVGNFRTRLEAERCLKKISFLYTNAFIVPDVISFPKVDETSAAEIEEE